MTDKSTDNNGPKPVPFRQILDRIPGAREAMDRADLSSNISDGFVPIMWTCEVHGEYPMLVMQEGVIRAFPRVCPTCQRQQQADLLMGGALIPERFRRCEFDNYIIESGDQARAVEICRDYAKNFAEMREDGVCLVLRGNPGTGKNHLATAIAKAVLAQGFSVMRLKVQEYLDGYWGREFSERAGWVSGFARVDLLVLDELGRTAETQGVKDALFRLLDARYEAVLPILLLTNLTKPEIEAHIGAVNFERLVQGGGRLANFEWDSYRRRAGR
jgi:DNA replication protein DnaC